MTPNYLKFYNNKHGVRSGPGQLYRTRLCKYGAECSYGVKCYYAHSDQEIRHKLALPVARVFNGKREQDDGPAVIAVASVKKTLSESNFANSMSHVLTRASPTRSSSTISSENPNCPPPPVPTQGIASLADSTDCSWSSTCDELGGNTGVSPANTPPVESHSNYYEVVLGMLQQHTSRELHQILKQAEPAYYTD